MKGKLAHIEHTSEKAWKYRRYEQQILSQLADALILNNMKVGNTGNAKDKKTELKPLKFDKSRKISQSKGVQEKKKGPVDVLGDIEKINFLKIRDDIKVMLDDATGMDLLDKQYYLDAVDEFIQFQVLNPRRKLEAKDGLLHKKFRKFYTRLAFTQKELSEEEKRLYKDICLVFANKLYGMDKSYLDPETGEINAKGLNQIAKIFLRAINNIPTSGSSKAFHKIFHDGDFNFLRGQNSLGDPIVGTLDHYVKAVMYLMDSDAFNAYAEDGADGAKERSKSKKSLLNTIFVASQMQEEEKTDSLSGKGKLHQNFAEKWREVVVNLEDQNSRESTDRLKTEASKMLKLGGRSESIQDESGLRVVYYQNPDHSKEVIARQVSEILKSYFYKIATTKDIRIDSIQTDQKGNFLTDEQADEVIQVLNTMLKVFPTEIFSGKISKRGKSKVKSPVSLQKVADKYFELTGTKPNEGLKRAYEIANGDVKRGSNGDYKDFKLLVRYTIQDVEDKAKIQQLCQEISFYPHTNELNMGNHHFLDLEKKIFNRVKNMNDGELGKSISLNRVRYFTETAIKDIAFDIDCYDEKVSRGLLPPPQNDAHQFLEIEGEKISLKGMVYRNKENSERFDRLITHVINYFIKNNKLAYINNPNQNFYGLITPEMLHDKKTFKLRRFLTSDVLKQTALDVKNVGHSISFYTENQTYLNPNFYTVSLEMLGDFIGLEKHLKT